MLVLVLATQAARRPHNQSAFALEAHLLYHPNTVVTSVPVLVEETEG